MSTLSFTRLELSHALGLNPSVSNYLLFTISNDERNQGLLTLRASSLYFVENVEAFNDLPKDNLWPNKVLAWAEADGEAVRAAAGNGKVTSLGVVSGGEFFGVGRVVGWLATNDSGFGWDIFALSHELGGGVMEWRALEVGRVVWFGCAFAVGAQASETLSSFRRPVCEELHCDSASFVSTDGDVEVDFWVGHLWWWLIWKIFKQNGDWFLDLVAPNRAHWLHLRRPKHTRRIITIAHVLQLWFECGRLDIWYVVVGEVVTACWVLG